MFTRNFQPSEPSSWDVARSKRALGPGIPQRRYTTSRSLKLEDSGLRPIEFCTVDGHVFMMRDALDRIYTGLIARDDRSMFTQCGASITLRIEWPGYKPWSHQIRTTDWRKARNPITLARLSFLIAKSIAAFIQDMEHTEINAEHATWKVGTGHINIDNLVLVCLDPVSKSSWQPLFHLANPV